MLSYCKGKYFSYQYCKTYDWRDTVTQFCFLKNVPQGMLFLVYTSYFGLFSRPCGSRYFSILRHSEAMLGYTQGKSRWSLHGLVSLFW